MRSAIRDIGYTDSAMGFDADTCAVLTAIEQQSPDISQGVTRAEGLHKETGRRRSGPDVRLRGRRDPRADADADHALAPAGEAAGRCASQGKLPWLRPDAKSQVTVEYGPDGRPARIDAVVLSTQHAPEVKHKQLVEAVIEEIIKPVLPADLLDNKTKFFVNPTGRFVVGGPYGDCGLTGRKIIVDSYGGMGRMAAAPSAARTRRRSTAARPTSRATSRRTSWPPSSRGAARCRSRMRSASPSRRRHADDLRHRRGGGREDRQGRLAAVRLPPGGLIETLDLRRPIYRPTAAYGHFGREKSFTWEKTDKSSALAADAGIVSGAILAVQGNVA